MLLLIATTLFTAASAYPANVRRASFATSGASKFSPSLFSGINSKTAD